MENEVLATVKASPARRWTGVGMLAALGLICLYVALFSAPALHLRLFLLVLGLGALWMADRMRQATARAIELTEHGLRSSDGRVIADLDDIEAVDRGMFAFKPSNGFLLKLRTPSQRAWQPGLWWRFGRRVGIGGVVPRHQTKLMADILTERLLNL